MLLCFCWDIIDLLFYGIFDPEDCPSPLVDVILVYWVELQEGQNKLAQLLSSQTLLLNYRNEKQPLGIFCFFIFSFTG